MTALEILLKEIEETSMILKESNSESKSVSSLKSKIKKFITNENKDSVLQSIPKIINYIKRLFNRDYSKMLLTFMVTVLLSVGINLASVKEIYTNNNVDNYINWTQHNTINTNKLKSIYEIGEYKIDDSVINKLYNVFLMEMEKDDTVNTINTDIVITTSKEDNDRYNFSNDDTSKDKAKGGKLSQKRKKEMQRVIAELENKLGVKIAANIISEYGSVRGFKFTDTELLSDKQIETTKKDAFLDTDINTDNTEGAFIEGGNGKDISDLSKNYQFVELLKLGGIETERVQGDNRTNPYADWIINTRKNPKRMMKRLQMEYPEYSITFNMDSVAKTPVYGAVKGMSNIKNQYQEINDSVVLSFTQFVNENNSENQILRVWQKILGDMFPNLTIQQAESFDQNIDVFLNYLEQMYGSALVNFTYNKIE